MGRPDWRAMLAGMTSTEYADWRHFYRMHYFHDTQLDMHFSGLTYAVLSLFFCDPDNGPAVADEFDKPTTDIRKDRCSKCMRGCEMRGMVANFGGFLSINKLSQ
ncbi:TPA: phage tail assembly protein T [Escherichia coli]|nr:phage tail assembly protein T [Escherichia coli]